MKFNCDKCGACCRAVNCKYLTKDNLCSIYDSRPIFCDIDKGYELIKDKVSKIEFYKLNEQHCNILKSKEKSK